MVVVLVPAVNKICESFTYNPLTRSQVKPTFLSLMGIRKECIANTSEFNYKFGGGKHGCSCIAMDYHQYALNYHITFVPPRKPGRSPMYPLNPTHVNITAVDQ